MKKIIIIFALMLSFSGSSCSQPGAGPGGGVYTKVYRGSNNFSVDLKGEQDVRPGCWGLAGYAVKTVTFNPPPGYRVRILRAYGDMLAWPRGVPAPGTYAGILFGLQTTAQEGSIRADWLADNTMMYIQGAVSDRGRERLPFDYKIADGYLESDHKLLYKFAVWLNDTGLEMHTEASVTLEYTFEPL